MSKFENKVDFALVISVKNANPNGDPLNGNRPRATYSNVGEISDVCIKRKIRNRFMQNGNSVFVQSDDNKIDAFGSLSERFDTVILANASKKATKQELYDAACAQWIDVRAFGQVFAFKKVVGDGVSIGVRGPVSIQPAFSASPVSITSTQITKSVNSEPTNGKKSSDTMGMKHRIDFGLYMAFGSINVELAGKTGFSTEDAQQVKQALLTLFENDESSARPAGSMEVAKLIWWEHNNASGQYSSAKVHRALTVSEKCASPGCMEDYTIEVAPLEGLPVEIIDGN